MSKDGQDDKKINNDKEKQKDTPDLQALNALRSIISRMYSASNPADLRNIANDAKNIRSDDPRIQDIIEKVQEVVSRKELVAENQLNSEIIQRELIELAQQVRDADLQMHKDIIEQKKNALISLNSQFTQTISQSTENYKMRTNSLKDINLQLNQGTPIDESKLDNLVLSKEEMDEIKKMYEQSKEIHNHYKEIHEEDKLLQANLESLNEKLKGENLSHFEKQELMKDLNLIKEKIIEHKPLVSLVDKMYKENKELMELRQSELKKYGQAIDEFGQIAKERYPNNKGLKNHHTVLKEQHNKVEKEYKLIGSDLDNNPASKLIQALATDAKTSQGIQGKVNNGFSPSNSTSAKFNKNDKTIKR